MVRILLSLLFVCTLTFGEDELSVHVTNQTALAPLYLHFVTPEKNLEKILRFDLDHNGKTYVVDSSKEIATQLTQEKEWNTFHKSGWERLKIPYVVKVEITGGCLSLALFSAPKNSVKGFEKIPLTGRLAEDRRTLHRLADALHEELFGTPGICSTKLIYTLRKKTGENSSDWETEVWQCDYDGGNPHQLTHVGALCVTPAYLSDSKGFMYVSYQIGQPKIFLASTENGQARRLSYLRGNQLTPSLAPKGDLIAFVSDITGNPELFVQEFNPIDGAIGKPRQIFSAPSGAQGCPTFSPEGERIAFVSNKDGTPRIYVMDVPRAGASVNELKADILTKKNRGNTCPAWSPDGKKLAYACMTNGVRQIWIYDFLTHEEMQLTEGQSHKENPTWAPDSLHLLFNTAMGNSAELYLLNINQKEMVKISNGPGEKRYPAWQPGWRL